MVETANIITVTLNPALDHSIYLPCFQIGKVNRVQEERLDPGGKGINVANVIRSLGEKVTVTGFLGQDNVKKFQDFFLMKDIEDHFITLQGATRSNMKLIDQTSCTVTEVNFPGLAFQAADYKRLEEKIAFLASSNSTFILSGSLPPNAPSNIYAQLIAQIKTAGGRAFLDTSGEALQQALTAKPYAIKPNVEELSQLYDLDLTNPSNLRKIIDELLHSGIELVVVSLGADGAIFAKGKEKLLVKSPTISVNSTVGAGDAMVGGIAVATLRNFSLQNLARLATASAAAAVATEGTQSGSLAEVQNLEPLVQITNWEES
ncbi:MAG: 1-phosphofructokinase [Sporomusaceae bacterium]|nr:1-phosphofructokinase [Sporomusaceae bacterium]